MVGFGQHSKNDRQAGFTLVEMMVVVAIMGIIASFAYPNMQRQIAQMKVRDAANLIDTTLKQARSDALIYRSNVVVATTGRTITVTQGSNSISKTLDNKLDTLASASMTFTPTKTVTSPTDLSVCYTGISTDKYMVKIDAMSNINTVKNGNC